MPDREKVIKGITAHKLNNEDCKNCPYTQIIDSDCEKQLMRDTLELLEERTAEAEMEGGGTTWWFVCGECHTAIDTKDKYCRECGRRIVWV